MTAAHSLAGLTSTLCSLLAPPVSADSVFKVGSFTKSTNTSVPVSQDVAHGLGTTPKALILWMCGGKSENFAGSFLHSLGFTDGTNEYSAAAASLDGNSKGDNSKRYANKAITIVQWGESLIAEADLSSWGSTNFTLSWTTNNSTAYVIHFLAIGGSDISAKAVNWQMPTSTGNKSITGTGFQPDVVFHIHTGAWTTNAPPYTRENGNWSFSAMDRSGDQWLMQGSNIDNSSTTDGSRNQRTDACIGSYRVSSNPETAAEATYVSMDSDGFTVNFNTVQDAAQVFSFALKGLNVKVGSFTKSTSTLTPVSQAVSFSEFEPDAAMLAYFQDTTQAGRITEYRFGIGASDGTTEGCTAVQDKDNVGTSSADRIDKTSKVFVKVNNNTPTIDAEADMSSLDSGGFTLSWTTNDAVATEILYVAMGSLDATEVELESFTVARDGDGSRLAWRTGREIDNLGFHVWRETKGRFERATERMVPGSALLAGPGTPLTAGGRYAWRDTRTGSRYWLESIDLKGSGPGTVPRRNRVRSMRRVPIPPQHFRAPS